MYDIFYKLCEEKGVTPYRVCKETGITTATISNWKAGRYVPKADKMKKIADYFDVTVEYLMTGEESKDYSAELSSVETLAAHFDGEDLSEEEMEEIMKYVEFVKSRRKK